MALPCREIENLLTPAVITSIVREYERDPELALREFDSKGYRHESLGSFIESGILPPGYVSRRSGTLPYAEESGTVKDKLAFAEKALRCVVAWDQVSGEGQRLTEAIYRFIASRNARAINQAARSALPSESK
jgi:hypothetical protein